MRRATATMFQSLKGFQRFCGKKRLGRSPDRAVSIPKRVSEVLWPELAYFMILRVKFQSLKGFQRFCGRHQRQRQKLRRVVSIPKRVSEVLWLTWVPYGLRLGFVHNVSIPKRVSEVLWLCYVSIVI